MMPITPLPISEGWRKRYFSFRVALYIIMISAVTAFALSVLFPTFVFPFNFRTPQSSKNTLLEPRTPAQRELTNGKVASDETLITNAGIIGNFSHVNILVRLEKDSPLPDSLSLSLRKSYRGFLLPAGEPLSVFPRETLFRIEDTYYALRDDVLFPFVSEQAFLSRYPADFAQQASRTKLTEYSLSDQWLGYRVGSTVAFADGVFLIVSETEMRPVGSAEIFLAMGYRFEDVLPANEEELGIYKRGKIFILGDRHPDGTLYFDRDQNETYIIDDNRKRLITDPRYLAFLSHQMAPILVSSQESSRETACKLKPASFGRSLSCTLELRDFSAGHGSDYEITLTNAHEEEIDVNTLSVSFKTAINEANMLRLLSQVKQRVISRVGN